MLLTKALVTAASLQVEDRKCPGNPNIIMLMIIMIVDDRPLAAGHDGHLAPLPEGAAPVRVVQLVGGLAAAAAQDLLGVQDSAPELK